MYFWALLPIYVSLCIRGLTLPWLYSAWHMHICSAFCCLELVEVSVLTIISFFSCLVLLTTNKRHDSICHCMPLCQYVCLLQKVVIEKTWHLIWLSRSPHSWAAMRASSIHVCSGFKRKLSLPSEVTGPLLRQRSNIQGHAQCLYQCLAVGRGANTVTSR